MLNSSAVSILLTSLVSFTIESIFTAPTRAHKQLELAHEETTTGQFQGLAAWLVEGLKIQEAQ
jgi:hypothetical protein